MPSQRTALPRNRGRPSRLVAAPNTLNARAARTPNHDLVYAIGQKCPRSPRRQHTRSVAVGRFSLRASQIGQGQTLHMVAAPSPAMFS